MTKQKNLYTRYCIVCDKPFKTASKTADRCPEHKVKSFSSTDARVAVKHKAKPFDSSGTDLIIKQYYKAHKKVLSYGKVTSMIRNNEYKCVVCGCSILDKSHICSRCRNL